jgi:hypothetical protein
VIVFMQLEALAPFWWSTVNLDIGESSKLAFGRAPKP